MPQTAEQEQEISAAMLDMAKAAGLTEEEFNTMRSALEKGATLADVFNISREAMESGYSYAYNLYKAGNYKDACFADFACMTAMIRASGWGWQDAFRLAKSIGWLLILTVWRAWPGHSRIPRRSFMAVCVI